MIKQIFCLLFIFFVSMVMAQNTTTTTISTTTPKSGADFLTGTMAVLMTSLFVLLRSLQ